MTDRGHGGGVGHGPSDLGVHGGHGGMSHGTGGGHGGAYSLFSLVTVKPITEQNTV